MLECSLESIGNEIYEPFTANAASKSFEAKVYLSWTYNGIESADGLTNYSIRIFSREILFNQTFTYLVNKSQTDNGHHIQGIYLFSVNSKIDFQHLQRLYWSYFGFSYESYCLIFLKVID